MNHGVTAVVSGTMTETKPILIELTIPWVSTKTGTAALKPTRETLDGGDIRLFTLTVYPYLKESLPPEIFEQYFKQRVQLFMDCSTPDFIDASIKYFLGDSHLASTEAKLKLLTKIRDYLFQKERVKPRIIAPDKRRTNVTCKN